MGLYKKPRLQRAITAASVGETANGGNAMEWLMAKRAKELGFGGGSTSGSMLMLCVSALQRARRSVDGITEAWAFPTLLESVGGQLLFADVIVHLVVSTFTEQ